ncbi:splicing factor, arginine/serine-rich 19-like [Amphibalanus amphitrite]|uniref:splicing factor, arginine/serine-rich 19-like n=1 Tax=Amphibalanus amphitrite TaxID=1232801 RepID=UPI001C8FBA98|nr:splicing factor, arginine/serine-rich 19-like [Amphibalanus amphitrite]
MASVRAASVLWAVLLAWTAAVTGAAADGGRQGGSSLNRLGRLPSVASIPLARTSDQLPLFPPLGTPPPAAFTEQRTELRPVASDARSRPLASASDSRSRTLASASDPRSRPLLLTDLSRRGPNSASDPSRGSQTSAPDLSLRPLLLSDLSRRPLTSGSDISRGSLISASDLSRRRGQPADGDSAARDRQRINEIEHRPETEPAKLAEPAPPVTASPFFDGSAPSPPSASSDGDRPFRPSRRVIEPESPSEEAAVSPARSRSRAIAVISPPVSRRERLRKIAERRARVLERLAAAKSSRSSVSVQRTAPAAGPEPRRTAAAARRSSSRLENFRPSPRVGEATFRPTGPLGLSPPRSTPLHLVS